ncbi:MAG: thioredoxin [Bacteroidetes bacterium]|nr:thioredoxin [Bacteroidota bacterium]
MNLQDIPYIIYAEETPNPSSVKFVANKLLLVSGASADYQTPAEAGDAPIAKELFKFPFVKRIFIAANFVTITKHDSVEWEEIRDELRVFLTDYLNKGNAIVNKLPQQTVPKDSGFKETVSVNTQHVPPTNDIENKIIEVLEQYIRPAVEQDGGMITFKELKDGIVTVQMRGSCSGCPSSTMTLKAGIEALLKRLLPDHVKEVVSEAV